MAGEKDKCFADVVDEGLIFLDSWGRESLDKSMAETNAQRILLCRVCNDMLAFMYQPSLGSCYSP